ncbi:MAG TPA: hypothetical protein VFA98_06400 [Thermoanaerobaculia bacterium]|nr:hypothetical protein [Thermoanaerobaculia bacterium]
MTTPKKDEGAEIRWLVEHRRPEVRAVIRDFKRLTRGRRAEFGERAAYLVSLLELGLKDAASRKRAQARKKRKRAQP